MEISPFMLAKLLLYSIAFGIAVGVFYDANRIIRVLLGERYAKRSFERLYSLKLPFVKRELSVQKNRKINGVLKNIIVFFGDLFTLVFTGCGIVILNYSYNDGGFRGFSVIGVALGFAAYYFTAGKLIIFLLEPIAFLLKYCICAFFVFLGYPICVFLKFLIKNVRKMCFLCRFALEKRRRKVYNIKEKICLLEMAKNGFANNDLFGSGKERPDEKTEN